MYERLFKEFAENKLRYLVIGGIAVNFHGFARATGDLDIVLWLTETEILKFIDIVEPLGFKPRIPVPFKDLAIAEKRQEWIEQKKMKAFSLNHSTNPFEVIDVMIEVPFQFDELYARRVSMPFQGIQIPVVGIADLIKLKEWAGRERDKIDIKALRNIQEMNNGNESKHGKNGTNAQ